MGKIIATSVDATCKPFVLLTTMVKSVLFCFKCQSCFESSFHLNFFVCERFNMIPVSLFNYIALKVMPM